MQDDILQLAYEVSHVTRDKIHLIASVMSEARFLAINTRIEAARAGQAGVAFGLLADEMGRISSRIIQIQPRPLPEGCAPAGAAGRCARRRRT